jgi:hypothetical protein
MLKFIKSTSPLPWMCIGDFNEVLHQSEHVGVQERSHAQIDGFREMVDVCGLYDLGFEGRSWTFEKRVVGGSFCHVRLDHALATIDWRLKLPETTVRHLTAAASDHDPILLQWEKARGPRQRCGRKLFRYELMWESHEEFLAMLEQVWKSEGSANTLQKLKQKLLSVSDKLSKWGTKTFGHIRSELKKLNVELERLRSAPNRTGPTHEEIKIADKIVELNNREETMWRQRSRI